MAYASEYQRTDILFKVHRQLRDLHDYYQTQAMLDLGMGIIPYARHHKHIINAPTKIAKFCGTEAPTAPFTIAVCDAAAAMVEIEAVCVIVDEARDLAGHSLALTLAELEEAVGMSAPILPVSAGSVHPEGAGGIEVCPLSSELARLPRYP